VGSSGVVSSPSWTDDAAKPLAVAERDNAGGGVRCFVVGIPAAAGGGPAESVIWAADAFRVETIPMAPTVVRAMPAAMSPRREIGTCPSFSVMQALLGGVLVDQWFWGSRRSLGLGDDLHL
jgi:hypothetical protein